MHIKQLVHSRSSVNVSFLPTGKQYKKAFGVMNVFYENIKNWIALPYLIRKRK